MAANPLINQGVLNRVRGSVLFIDNPQLNVSAPFLGKQGISTAPEGDVAGYIGTMTGAVPSPEPYLIMTVSLHLLKTQSFGDLWKQQIETQAIIGDLTVYPDAATLSNYVYTNCTIKSFGELNFAGEDPSYMVTLQGTYNINSAMFDLN